MVVGVPLDRVGVGPIVLPKQVAGDPGGILPQDLVIDVFEQLELDRFAGPLGRLDAVDHHAPRAADEVAVEEIDRQFQLGRQLGLPVVPGVEAQIALRDAAAVLVEDVQVIAAARGRRRRTRRPQTARPPCSVSGQSNIRRA